LKAGAQSIKRTFQCNIFFEIFWFNPDLEAKSLNFRRFFKPICRDEFKA